jgi:hypothetical protein
MTLYAICRDAARIFLAAGGLLNSVKAVCPSREIPPEVEEFYKIGIEGQLALIVQDRKVVYECLLKIHKQCDAWGFPCDAKDTARRLKPFITDN